MTDALIASPHARARSTVIAMGLACVVFTGCGSGTAPSAAPAAESGPAPAGESPVIELSPQAMQAGGITVTAAREESRAQYFETPAVLQLDEARTARIGSLVEGVVVDAKVQAGAAVPRGARLAHLHSHMVHEAWAEYRRAQAERRRAASEFEYVKQAEARVNRLLAAKAASPQEAERARTDREAAEQALVIAESEITRAIEELEHLGIKPDASATADPMDTVPVNTPIGGVVMERLVSEGTAVTPGTPLFVVSDLSRLWAVAEIDEVRLPTLSVGRAAELTVAAYPDRTFAARVAAIGHSLNPDTRRIAARIEVENRDGSLKPQMFATVRVPTADQMSVVVVPTSAVQKLDQQTVVFVEERPARFVPRSVVVGQERDGMAEIREGLRADERVATGATFLLKSKMLEGSQAE